jgi:hypothetical protein
MRGEEEELRHHNLLLFFVGTAAAQYSLYFCSWIQNSELGLLSWRRDAFVCSERRLTSFTRSTHFLAKVLPNEQYIEVISIVVQVSARTTGHDSQQ